MFHNRVCVCYGAYIRVSMSMCFVRVTQCYAIGLGGELADR